MHKTTHVKHLNLQRRNRQLVTLELDRWQNVRPIMTHTDRCKFTVRRVGTVRGKRRTRSQHNDVDIVMSVYPRNPWIDGGTSDDDRRLGTSARVNGPRQRVYTVAETLSLNLRVRCSCMQQTMHKHVKFNLEKRCAYVTALFRSK